MNRDKLARAWQEATPPAESTDLRAYFDFVGLRPEEYADVRLRYHNRLRCEWIKNRAPAMVACVVNPENQLAALHATFLRSGTEDWTGEGECKVIRESKLTGAPALGSSVRLFDTSDSDSLIVGTTIEVALSARAIVYRQTGNLFPCWATLTVETMKWMPVPERIRKVRIAVDNNANYASQMAGYMMAHRLMVGDPKRKVKVWVPDQMAMDFNDELKHLE